MNETDTRSIDDLLEDLHEATEHDARGEAPFERLRDALSELRTHRELAKGGERDLGRVCECGHPRGDHLLGRGACSGEGESTDELEIDCDCGDFRTSSGGGRDVDFECLVESPEGFVTVRVRCSVGAPADAYRAARAVAHYASVAFNGPASRVAETLSPSSSRRLVTVSVNGEAHPVDQGRITYKDVVTLAGMMSGEPSVTWSKLLSGERQRRSGTLSPNGEIEVEDGMVFRVVHTGGG